MNARHESGPFDRTSATGIAAFHKLQTQKMIVSSCIKNKPHRVTLRPVSRMSSNRISVRCRRISQPPVYLLLIPLHSIDPNCHPRHLFLVPLKVLPVSILAHDPKAEQTRIFIRPSAVHEHFRRQGEAARNTNGDKVRSSSVRRERREAFQPL